MGNEELALTLIIISLPLFLVALVLYVIRTVTASSVPDKILAIDALGYDLAVFLVVLSILFRSPILIPCAIVLALWVYALDIYIAKYLEARELGE